MDYDVIETVLEKLDPLIAEWAKTYTDPAHPEESLSTGAANEAIRLRISAALAGARNEEEE